MTRRLTKLAALYLLLGLVTTWAVAWGAVMLWKPDGGAGRAYLEPLPPYRVVTMDTLPATIASQVQLWADPGAVEHWRQQASPERLEVRELPGIIRAAARPLPELKESGQPGGLAVECRGWPSYALYCKLAPYYPFGSAQDCAFGAIAISSHSDDLYAATLLPCIPYWPGLLANTLFYALLLATLHQLTAYARRARRRRRNRCAACNYDLRGLTTPTCPECGRALSPAHRATATPDHA
ncbi:MAG: hypothetical protein IT431_17365 [Phycisphaerales bacterium]|nr:hypothetical protein [Phycisphaerales bacterium]